MGRFALAEAALTHINSAQLDDYLPPPGGRHAIRGGFPIWLATPESLPTLLSTKQVFDLSHVFDVAEPNHPYRMSSEQSDQGAEQCVVMGDENQLPPTTFFERTDRDDDMIPELREFWQVLA
jgi:hypothetical protein